MKLRALVLSVVIGGAMWIGAWQAAAHARWSSDTFRSPTGNLICKYRWNIEAITCGAYSSQQIIHLRSYGRPVEGNRITWSRGTWFPTLRYGETWAAGEPISCRSLWAGMRCQNQDGWYFLLARDRVVVGRYGTALYRL